MHKLQAKSIEEAITLLMSLPLNVMAKIGPLIIRDLLAQRFGAAMIEHPECDAVLNELFKSIVGEE